MKATLQDVERWKRVSEVLDALLDLETAERPARIDELCAGDPLLQGEVQDLLAGLEAKVFFESPAASFAATMLDAEQREWDGRTFAGRIIGPYRLVRELGHGGMGVVYLAERADGQFEQQVALKLIKRGMGRSDMLRRFLAERQVLARLNHPNIARLYDGGVTGEDQPYFAMEYIEGAPLDVYCDERKLGIEERLTLFLEVCGAVQYAHQNLIVHRDLKPSNILVTRGGQTRLVDFGIAKVLEPEVGDSAVTETEERFMTPAYAAPEQVLGLAVTTATDVYALGAILYHLLSGRPPHRFSGCTRAERDRIICEVDPEPPSGMVRNTPAERKLRGDLDVIVLKALRKDPARRYPTVEALQDDLERHRNGLPVRARPDSVTYRARKFVARHRLAVGAAALLVLALATGLAGTLWQARATEREAAKARTIKDFVVGLFQASRPEESRGQEVTARDLLERGTRRVETGLARQPGLQADLLDVLGVIHRDLGLYPQADSLLGRAVRLSRERHGDADPDVALKLTDWATVLAARGDYAGAESLLTTAHRILRGRRGANDTTVAAALGALASVQRQRGNFVAAESLYREALRIDVRRRGGDQLRVAADLDHLALVHEEAGNFARADSGYQQALALRRANLDADHPQVIMSLHHLADLREKQGDFPQAEHLQREVLERRRRVYPPGHPEIAYALQSLANTLRIQGGYAEAESLSVAALGILRDRLGLDHPETLELRNGLAELEYEKGDLPRAEAEFREVVGALERSLGRDHPTTLLALNNLAAVLKYQRRFAEAEPLYRETLATRRRRLGDSHPDVGESWGNLAEMYWDKGELLEAEKAYRQTLTIYQAALPAGHVFISGTLVGLGGVLTDRGRPAAAEPLLREALELRLQRFGADDRRTAKAQRMLGLCLMALGQREQAEELLLASYRTLAPAKNWYHRTLGEQTRRDLATLYTSWGRRAEAARLTAGGAP